MRVDEYLRTSLHDIRMQPLRSLLTITAIAISSALFVTLVSLSIDGRAILLKRIGADASMNSIIVSNSSTTNSLFGGSVQVAQESSAKITDDTIATIAGLPHVRSVQPQVYIWELKKFTIENTSKTFVSRVVAAPPGGELLTGAWYDKTSSEPLVVVGKSYVDALGIKNPSSIVGRKISFETTAGYRGTGATIPPLSASRAQQQDFSKHTTTLSATITGVTPSGTTDNQLYIPIGWGREIGTVHYATADGERREDMIEKNGYSTLIATIDDKEYISPTVTSIESLGYGASSYQRQIEQLNQLMLIMWIILGSIALIGMISAALGIINTLLMTVTEQRSTIYIWRACGATKSTVARLYMTQACVVGLVGGVLGAIIGVFVTRYVHNSIVSILITQGVTITDTLPHLATIVVGTVALTTLIACIAGIYPAHRAAKRSIE